MFRGTVSVAAMLLTGIVFGCSDGSDTENDAGTAMNLAAFNMCPIVSSIEVSPLETGKGGQIELRATVADTDDNKRHLRYRWFAEGGVLSNPYSLETNFRCRDTGIFSIVFAVEDRDGCYDYKGVEITCTDEIEPPGPADTDEKKAPDATAVRTVPNGS